MAQVMTDRRGITYTENSVGLINQGTSENFSNSVDQAVLETVIVIRSDEGSKNEDTAQSRRKPNKVLDEDEVKMKDLKDEKLSCVIDVKSAGSGSGAGGEGFERVCRICQLSSELSGETSMKEMDLIQLGCGCKDEMGIAHSHCAETWFKLKGNRVCEICGEAAKNITGIRDQSLMDEWNEGRSSIPGSEGSEGCWRRQPYCNFLMACLIVTSVEGRQEVGIAAAVGYYAVNNRILKTEGLRMIG